MLSFLKINDAIIKKLKIPDNVIYVTGNSGKHVTAKMIVQTLKSAGFSVISNLEKSSKVSDIKSFIVKYASLSSIVKKDVMVIIIKPEYIIQLLNLVKPKHIVITNLFQGSINGNESIAMALKDVITQDIHLILNADDPLISTLGYMRKNVTYFGMNNVLIDKNESNHLYDDKYCPICKSLMQYEYFHFGNIGKYQCTKCEFKRKEPQCAITDVDLDNGIILINKKHQLKVVQGDLENAYNTVAAYATAKIYGIEEKKIVRTLTNINIKNMLRVINFCDKQCKVLSVKYGVPNLLNQRLLYIASQKSDCVLIIFVDDNKEKISDTSWFWNINFEYLLSNYIKKIILIGKYTKDFVNILIYMGIAENKVESQTDFKKLVNLSKEIKDVYMITDNKDFCR